MPVSPSRQTRSKPAHTRVGEPFSIEELGVIMAWSQARMINSLVLLDHIDHGHEFEEVVLLTPCGQASPSLACWRDAEGVLVGPVGRTPVAFWSVTDMLLTLSGVGEPRDAGPLAHFMIAAGLVPKGYLKG